MNSGHSDFIMTDIKLKYEELLLANRKLKEELDSLRLKEVARNDNKNSGSLITPAQVIKEIFDTVSSYLALFKVTEDKRILVLDLNRKAAEVESVKIKETSGKYITDTLLGERKKLVELIFEIKKTGNARKHTVSADGDDSEGHYIGFNVTSGNILVTWEPGLAQKDEYDIYRQNLIFERFADLLPEMIYEVDISGRVLYANQQGLKFFGYTREDLEKGVHISEVFPGNYQQMISNLKALKSPDQIASNEYNATRKDGSIVPILTHSFALIHNDRIIGYRGVVTDISRQKNYEDQINREKAFLEHLVDSIPEAIAIFNREGKISNINKEFTNLFGYTGEDAIGRNIDELIVPEELKTESEGIDTLTLEKHKVVRQTIRQDKNGNRIQVSLIASNMVINDEVVASLGIYRDISFERKSQLIQDILYNISTAALNQIDVKDIYPTIVHELNKIWDTNNFFIALYDKKSDTLSMPFFSDEKDKFENLPARKTITKWVISLKRSVLLKINDLKELENSGDIALVGTQCKVWMGVPLKAEKEIIGVMALQDYHDEDKFSQVKSGWVFRSKPKKRSLALWLFRITMMRTSFPRMMSTFLSLSQIRSPLQFSGEQ